MKKHTKIYVQYFRLSAVSPDEEFIACECGCGSKITDIHHIFNKGMGGSKDKDSIENLMGLARACHTKYGDKEEFYLSLLQAHEKRIKENGRPYNKAYFDHLYYKLAG